MPEQREPREGYIAVGRVLRPWGLNGDVKVEPLTDFTERFLAGARLWVDGKRRRVEHSREGNGFLYLKLGGVNSPDEAGDLRGLLLEVPESDLTPLAEGEFYHHQLTGLNVVSSTGEALGTVREILEPGPNSVFVVDGPHGEVLIPYIEDIVTRVDPAAGIIEVEVIEGLLPEPRAPRSPRFKRHQGRRQRRAARPQIDASANEPLRSDGGPAGM